MDKIINSTFGKFILKLELEALNYCYFGTALQSRFGGFEQSVSLQLTEIHTFI